MFSLDIHQEFHSRIILQLYLSDHNLQQFYSLVCKYQGNIWIPTCADSTVSHCYQDHSVVADRQDLVSSSPLFGRWSGGRHQDSCPATRLHNLTIKVKWTKMTWLFVNILTWRVIEIEVKVICLVFMFPLQNDSLLPSSAIKQTFISWHGVILRYDCEAFVHAHVFQSYE